MKKKNLSLAFVAIAIPIGAEFYFGKSPYVESTTLMSILWMIVNYLFLNTTYSLIESYNPILRLRGLTMRRTRLHLNLMAYYAALIFFNSYFLYNLYVRDNYYINRLANPLLMVVVLVTFFVNLLSGIFPVVKKTDNVTIYEVSPNLPFRNGREKVDVLCGTYDKGFVVGLFKFEFSGIKNIYEDKKNTLVIKGKDKDGNYRVNISAPKTKKVMEEYIKAANDLKLLDEGVVNIS